MDYKNKNRDILRRYKSLLLSLKITLLRPRKEINKTEWLYYLGNLYHITTDCVGVLVWFLRLHYFNLNPVNITLCSILLFHSSSTMPCFNFLLPFTMLLKISPRKTLLLLCLNPWTRFHLLMTMFKVLSPK